jgi:hypothetical protein
MFSSEGEVNGEHEGNRAYNRHDVKGAEATEHFVDAKRGEEEHGKRANIYPSNDAMLSCSFLSNQIPSTRDEGYNSTEGVNRKYHNFEFLLDLITKIL